MLPVGLVKKFLEDLEKDVTLTVYESREMLDFASRVSEISEHVHAEFVDEPEPYLKLPAIRVGESKIFFHAVPQHSELESFLHAVKLAAEGCCGEGDRATQVVTLVSKICPNCRKTVDSINKLAVKDGLEHHVVDVSAFPEFVERYNVCSVPTAIIGEFRLTGAMDEEEARKWIDAAIRGDSYEYLLEKLMNGEIEEVIRFGMVKSVGKELAMLMAHPEFMVRLGAMAAIESLNERKPESLLGAKDVIRDLLMHEDERIREDAAMMLGMIGGEEDAEYLETLRMDGRVGDSIREAIEAIRDRHG